LLIEKLAQVHDSHNHYGGLYKQTKTRPQSQSIKRQRTKNLNIAVSAVSRL